MKLLDIIGSLVYVVEVYYYIIVTIVHIIPIIYLCSIWKSFFPSAKDLAAEVRMMTNKAHMLMQDCRW